MALRPNQTYYYRVKAVSPEQESDYSDTIAVTTTSSSLSLFEPSPASSPSILHSYAEEDRIHLIIEPPTETEVIQEIFMQVSLVSDFSTRVYSIPYVLGTNTSYIEWFNEPKLLVSTPNLAADTLYYVRVAYRNALGASGYSSATVTTLTAIQAPKCLGVSDLTAITAKVLFTAISGATNHYVDVSTSSNFSSLVVAAANTGTADNYTIPVLIENTKYYVRVRAFDGTSYSKYSDTVSFTTLDNVETHPDLIYDLPSPQVRGIFNVFKDTARLEWYLQDTIDYYSVDISKISDFSSGVTTTQVNGNRLVFSNLDEDTLYYVRIRAVERDFFSEYTSTAFRTLATQSLFSPPALLGAAVVKSTSLEISWIQRTYATSYLLEYSTASNFSTVNRLFTGNVGKLNLTDLAPATLYYVRVYAITSTGTSEASTEVSYTTASALPAITLLASSSVSAYSFILNWTVNALYTSYLVTIYKNSSETSTGLNSSAYLGNGYYYLRDVGYVGSLLIDLFLEESSTYSYQIYGVTASGDIRESDVGTVTTSTSSPFIQLNSAGNAITWSGKLNRLVFATDREFKNQIAGLDPVVLTGTELEYNLGYLAERIEGYHIAGYYSLNGIDTDFSNIISTAGIAAPITYKPKASTTTATFRWKTEKTSDIRFKLMVDTGLAINPVSGYTTPVSIGPTSTYTVSNLSPDTVYLYSIQYLKDGAYTKLTAPITFNTLKYATLDDVDENVTIGTLAAPAVTLNKTHVVLDFQDDFDSYMVEVYSNSTRIEPVEVLYSDLPNFEYAIEPSSTLYFTACGIDETAEERTAKVLFQQTAPKLVSATNTALTVAPTISGSTVLNDNEAQVIWSATAGATKYRLEVSLTSTFNLLDKTVGIIFSGPTTAIISGLLGTQLYYVRVLAYNNKHVSPYSNTLTVDTVP